MRGWVIGAAILFIVGGFVESGVGFIYGKKANCGVLWSDYAKGVCDGAQIAVDPSYTPSPKSNGIDCNLPLTPYAEGFCTAKRRASSLDKDPTNPENVICGERRLTTLCEFNIYVVTGIKALDPFNFAKTFYDYLWYGKPPDQVAPYVFAQPLPKVFESNGILILASFVYRAIPGAIYATLAVVSTGWISTITAVIAVIFGFLAVRSLAGEGSATPGLLGFLLIPLVGGAFVWVLTQLMLLGGWIFRDLLEAAEAYTALSILGTTVWASFKKSENDFSDRLIKRSLAILFK